MTFVDIPPPVAPKNISQIAAKKLHLSYIERLEIAFERVVLRSLKRALNPIAKQFNALTAQGEPVGEPFISLDDLGQIRMIWAEQVAQELLPLLAKTHQAGSQGVSLAIAGVATDIPDVVSVGAQEWLTLADNRLQRVGDTAWFNAREELLEGFQQGESIPELSKRVRSVVDVSAGRAKTIARTEVIGATNAGAFAEAVALGVETKEWLSTEDARTRPAHVRADGQKVALDDMFTVGGFSMRFPHDPLAPPELSVNCRCTTIFDDRPLCMCNPSWVKREMNLISSGEPDCGCSE